MKQGTTTTFKVKQFDLPDITEIIFSFTNDKNNVVVERTTPTTDDGQIHKSYPSEVSLEDGYYKIGLDQDETLSLNETFYVEAQIMFSGAVTKAYIDKVKMPHTFYTKVISGATTNGEEIELAMELSDVIEIEGGGSSNYNDLTNKPKINNIELVGNKTTSDLGLDIEVGDGLKREGNVVSVALKEQQNYMVFTDGKLGLDLTSLGSLPTLRQALANTSYLYALASKTYVDNLMSGAVKRLVVQTLPTDNIDANTIYMILKSAPTTNNIYDEYMYINNAWELIGSTEVDLSNYYTKTESDNKYQNKLTVGNGIDITSDVISAKLDNNFNLLTLNSDGLSANAYTVGASDELRQTLSGGGTANTRLAKASDLASKQDTLIPSTNITIGADGKTISATDTTYTAGTNITIDSNNVISASGGGLSYTFTDGLTESSGTVGIDLKSGTELQITNDQLDIDLSGYATTSSVSGKEDKTTISTDTSSTTVSLTLADNHEYRYTQDLTSLTLTMPSGDFISSIVFASGTTATQMTYDSSIKWSGDDVTSNAFVPTTSKTYNIVLWYDGINVNGIVRGV